MQIRRFLLIAPALMLGASAFGQVSFDPPVPYAVGTRPGGSAMADFTGDGFRDIAVTIDTPDRIALLINNGSGALTPGGTVVLPSGSGAGAIVAADLDGDGDMDLAVALQNSNRVIVAMNNGAGTFTVGGSFATGGNPRGLTAADLNGDGRPDLATANRDTNNATVLLNQGGGVFAPTNIPAGAEPRGVALGDFDNDGDVDLAVSNHDDRTISIFSNNGSGAFAPAGTLSTGAQRPEGAVSADFNGDGLWDLAAAANGNGLESALVYLATGGMAFGGGAAYPTGGVDTSDIVAADLDCNGSMDLITSNATSGNFSALQNSGAGAFGAATVVASGANPERVSAGDLNGDGAADIAVANRDSNNLTVHINTTCGGGYSLTLTGTCPGPVTVSWSGAQPGGRQALLFASIRGSFRIPQGQPCAGTVLGLGSNQLRIVTPPGVFSTGNGSGSLQGNAGPAVCGGFLQLIQAGNCQTSNVAGL